MHKKTSRGHRPGEVLSNDHIFKTYSLQHRCDIYTRQQQHIIDAWCMVLYELFFLVIFWSLQTCDERSKCRMIFWDKNAER